MIAMPVSGYLGSTAGGRAVSWFSLGLFELPRLVAKDRVLAAAATWAHLVFAWMLGSCWPRISAPSSGTQ